MHHADRPTLKILRLASSSTKALATPVLFRILFVETNAQSIDYAGYIARDQELSKHVKKIDYVGRIFRSLYIKGLDHPDKKALIDLWKAGHCHFRFTKVSWLAHYEQMYSYRDTCAYQTYLRKYLQPLAETVVRCPNLVKISYQEQLHYRACRWPFLA